jgi:hypothetical protein
LWNLNSHEKPRFNKLKGHVASFDLWEELLLVLGKGALRCRSPVGSSLNGGFGVI